MWFPRAGEAGDVGGEGIKGIECWVSLWGDGNF